MRHLRTLRKKLAPGFARELSDHGTQHEPPADPDWGPRIVHALVEDASRARASDIHIEPFDAGALVRFRVDGIISDVAAITSPQARLVINQIKALANLDPVANFTPKDAHAYCAVESGQIDLRLALSPAQTGEALTIRLLDRTRLKCSIADLGLVADDLRILETWMDDGAGMFLAAGPTGCGKTTTIYSLLQELKGAERAIVSLEDPVEYQLDGVVQIQLNERHHLNFGEGIKSMLRLDPDFLMIGEIRDAVSARAAVDAAISGRVLLSTLHCRDAVGAVTALRNWGLHDHEIAEALSVVVGQRLVRRLCVHCRTTREVTNKEQHWFSTVGLAVPESVQDAAGCNKCGHLGYAGRLGIFELWRLSEADYAAILDHTDEHALRRSLAEREHRSIFQDGLSKVIAGVTSVSELRRVSGAVFPSQRLMTPKSESCGAKAKYETGSIVA